MKITILMALIAMSMAGPTDPLSTVDPAFPPNAVGGGIVVATLEISSGSVKRVNVVSGEEPFAGSARTALSAWKFSASADTPQRVTVVVSFAPPTMQSTGIPRRSAATPRESGPGAYPRTVLDPQYPANGTGQGSVVLAADLDANGGVGKIDVVKGLGAFTQAGVQAVQQWRFSPARDASGNKRPSRIYTVLVFRAPVL